MSYQVKMPAKTGYSTFNLFIRSFLFSIYSLTSIFLYSFVCLLSMPAPVRVRCLLLRWWLQAYLWMLKKVCLIDHVVEGQENIFSDRTGIIMSKHQSTWETFFLPILFNEPAIILKRELLWVPFFGWGLAASDPIAIDRRNKATAMNQIIAEGKIRLAQGRWILVFPEGTRVPYGEVGHYRLGGARLAVATSHPILPVAHNAGRFWPRRQFIKTPGTVRIVVGPPIETKGRTPEEVLAETKAWIETTVRRIDGFVDESPGH
ncbi:MAG: 1-acyl-sn-glycerol-3-phosphate acyltransferase [Gammaproteobacteria bacterium]|nr:1-acyl-sn-glycerol-3-phosphate acyltransferase [Gammaproteobacteria bacterium]